MDQHKAQVKNLKEKLIRSAYEKHLKEKSKSRRDSRTNLIDDSEPEIPAINVTSYEDEKWDFSLKKSEFKFKKLDQVPEVDDEVSKGSSSQGQQQQLLKSNLTGSADEMNVLQVQKSLKKNLNIESDSESDEESEDFRSKKGKNSLKVKNLRRKSRSWSPSSFYRLIKGSSSSNIYTNFENIKE